MNMKKNALYGMVGMLALMPVAASADVKNLQGLITAIINLIDMVIPLLFGIALLVFIWGVIGYLFRADPAKIKDARNYMIFSIVAIAVMLSVWALAFFFKNTLFPSACTPLDPGCARRMGGGYSSGVVDSPIPADFPNDADPRDWEAN